MKKIKQFNRGKALDIQGEIKLLLRANLTLLDEKDIPKRLRACIKYCEHESIQDFETCGKLKKKLDAFLDT